MKASLQYGLSTLGKTIPFAAADAFTLYFYTDVVGIAPGLAGAMVLALLSWSALCDPLAGWLYQTAAPRGRAWFGWGTAAATLFFILGFVRLPPAALLLAGTAFRFAYALIDVPHNALLGNLQRDGQSPARLGGLRLFATIAGTLAAIAASRYALEGAAPRFLVFAAVTGVTGGLLFLVFFPFTVLHAPAAAMTALASAPRPPAIRAALISSAFFLSAVAATVVNGMFSKDIVYIAKYVLRDPGWTVVGMALFTVGKVAGMPLWIWLSERRGAVSTMQASFALVMATGVGVAVAPPHFSYLGVGLLFFGAGIGGTNIAGWTLMPGCAGLFRSGSEPLFFGAFTAVNKIASGFSGAIIGYTLMWLGIGSNPISLERQTRSLYWLVYIYPIAGAAIGIAGLMLFALLRSASSNTLQDTAQ